MPENEQNARILHYYQKNIFPIFSKLRRRRRWEGGGTRAPCRPPPPSPTSTLLSSLLMQVRYFQQSFGNTLNTALYTDASIDHVTCKTYGKASQVHRVRLSGRRIESISGITSPILADFYARYAVARICYRPSVCLSVCPSVRHTGGSVKNG